LKKDFDEWEIENDNDYNDFDHITNRESHQEKSLDHLTLHYNVASLREENTDILPVPFLSTHFSML